jgi:hypothetical protein
MVETMNPTTFSSLMVALLAVILLEFDVGFDFLNGLREEKIVRGNFRSIHLAIHIMVSLTPFTDQRLSEGATQPQSIMDPKYTFKK